jgi:hypothetical protein
MVIADIVDVNDVVVNDASIGATTRDGGGEPPPKIETAPVTKKPQIQTTAAHF